MILKHENEIKLKLSNLTYKQLPLGIFGEFVVYTTALILNLNIFDRFYLIFWYVVVSLIIIIRMITVLYHNKYFINSLDQLNKWINVLIINALLAGICWIPIGTIFMPILPSREQMIMLFVLSGAIVIGNMIYSAFRFLYVIFLLPFFIPHVVWLFYHGYHELGLIAILFGVIMLFFSAYMNGLIVEALNLEFENKNLVKDLTITNIYLKKHQYELTAISRMNNELQICQNIKEAYTIISDVAQDLFTGLNGGIMVTDEKTESMSTITQWGSIKIIKEKFPLNDCYAVQRGSTYIINDPLVGIVCHHFEYPLQSGYICIPLIAQNKLIGILSLNAPSGQIISASQQNLATTFSDAIKLSLLNIELRDKLRDLALHDTLTGLFNRHYLNQFLDSEIKRVISQRQSLCVAMLDLDHFKKFNDSNGHEAGDVVLRFVGNLLGKSFRKADVACRFGGEEFIVVLVHIDLTNAFIKMNDIRNKIKERHLQFHGILLPTITVSIGLAEAPSHGMTSLDVIRAADTALYLAKQTGRDQVVIYDADKISTIT